MTFSVHTGDTVSELEFARMVADRYRTDHHEITLLPEEIHHPGAQGHVARRGAVFGERDPHLLPGAGGRDYVKVLLCGDGSDEIFGGYTRFQPLNLVPFLPPPLLTWGYVRGLNGPAPRVRRRLYAAPQGAFLGSNSNPFLDAALGGEGTVLDRLLRYEVTQQLPQHQLMRLDKLTMAHGVEARVPFLDVDLVAYATRPSLPLQGAGLSGEGAAEACHGRPTAGAGDEAPEVRAQHAGRPLFRHGLRRSAGRSSTRSIGTLRPFFRLPASCVCSPRSDADVLSVPEQNYFRSTCS